MVCMKNISLSFLVSYCLKQNKSLTPTRLIVIETLGKYKKPKSAYDLQKKINALGNKLNISTIYRVIDFWENLGLIHKIKSINKFILCMQPSDKHIHMLSLCNKCENVFESCSKAMGLNFEKSVSHNNMSIDFNSSIEISVVCRACK